MKEMTDGENYIILDSPRKTQTLNQTKSELEKKCLRKWVNAIYSEVIVIQGVHVLKRHTVAHIFVPRPKQNKKG